MKILSCHSGHDSNICYLVDGEVLYWNKFERLSRRKGDNKADALMLMYPEVRNNIDFSTLDLVIWGSPRYTKDLPDYNNTYDIIWKDYFSNDKLIFHEDHHLSHASHAFYGSGYNKSYVLVIDRNGSYNMTMVDGELRPAGAQTETLYLCEYPNKFEVIFANYSWIGITGKYGIISERCGIADIDNGKTMGLSAYGKKDINIKYELINNNMPAVNEKMRYSLSNDPEFRDNFLIKMSNKYSHEDMASFAQKESNRKILNIVKDIDFDKCSNLCFTGGHAHNCLTNYNIRQSLSENINFYVDPIPDDSNCSIGYAKYYWYKDTQSNTKFPLTNIYNAGE